MIFDIETNGNLEDLDTVHSLVIYDESTSKLSTFSDHLDHGIHQGLELLSAAQVLVGHNILCFDLPALKVVYGWDPGIKVFDTLTASRLIYTDLFDRDAKERKIDKKYWGSHSLKAWGFRLGIYKDDFGETSDWKEWSPEMQKYCEQDVKVNTVLYNYILREDYSSKALEIEHDFQRIIFKQQQNGVPFDVKRAREYTEKIKKDLEDKTIHIRSIIPKQIRDKGEFVPKRRNKTRGYGEGIPFTKIEVGEFNPGSRTQIIDYFKFKYNWQPTIFTAKENPKIDDTVLRSLEFPEAKELADYLEASKVLGYLETGKNAWLKLQRNGRIYGSVITNGAVTGRCTHSKPNLAQVPGATAYMGKECRSLFHSGSGDMVGADASGLELRCLAHYMYPYDRGEYAREILEGDVHTKNQRAAGLESRDQAKTFIYALIYGAGDCKLGEITTNSTRDEIKQAAGKKLRARFFRAIPALQQLIGDVKRRANQRGYLVGLDGRKLHIRSEHLALNTLLQSAGAILMKQATINFWQDCTFPEVYQTLHVHDEFEVINNIPKNSLPLGELMVASIQKAGEMFNFKIPLDGEYKIGKNWSEVH